MTFPAYALTIVATPTASAVETLDGWGRDLGRDERCDGEGAFGSHASHRSGHNHQGRSGGASVEP